MGANHGGAWGGLACPVILLGVKLLRANPIQAPQFQETICTHAYRA